MNKYRDGHTITCSPNSCLGMATSYLNLMNIEMNAAKHERARHRTILSSEPNGYRVKSNSKNSRSSPTIGPVIVPLTFWK